MKVIKPYGRSTVEQSEGRRERKLDIGARARNTTSGGVNAIRNVGEFLEKDEDYFIAQWVSMLDKLLPKPRTGSKEKLTAATFDARQKAADAFFKYWMLATIETPLNSNAQDALYRKWLKKVHPYPEKRNSLGEPQGNARTGRWFKVFSDTTAEKSDWNIIAERIYQHLYERQKKLNQQQGDKGLVTARSDSISRNARNYRLDGKLFQSVRPKEQGNIKQLTTNGFFREWDSTSQDYKLENLIALIRTTEANNNKQSEENKKHPKNYKPVLSPRQNAIACHHAHYNDDNVFGEIKVSEARQQKPDLWDYHCMIKEALLFQYPKKRKTTPRRELTENRLHHLAVSIERNRLVAFANRLGKVIHYEGGLDAASADNVQTIAQSDYWTTRGQTRIKQDEAFVRQWLGAITIANASLERLLDPERRIHCLGKPKDSKTVTFECVEPGQGGVDLFDSNAFQFALKQLDKLAPNFDHQFNLLLGEGHNLYTSVDERRMILHPLHQTLVQLRHATFHFKHIDNFIGALKEVKTSANGKIKPKVTAWIESHQRKQHELLIAQLESAGVENYLSQQQLDKIVEKSASGRHSLLPLPKLNRLLARAENKRIKQSGKAVIRPANALRMDSDTAYRCAFICLKLLYERDFPDWLENQNAGTINCWITQAKTRATGEAQKIQKDDTLQSRMERLRGLKTDSEGKAAESLIDYLSYITSEIASEFMVQQNVYDSNKQGAQALSNYVEQFKQDVLIHALLDYLAKNDLAILLNPHALQNQKAKCELPNPQTSAKTPAGSINSPWLYMAVHLMPVEFVNSLALQIRKHHVLTGEDHYKDVYAALSLYLDMHNVLAGDIKSLTNEGELQTFYDEEERFKQVFSDDNEGLIPVRGLREVLRFGNLHQLKKLFEDSKASGGDIDRLKELTKSSGKRLSPVAKAQKNREALHRILCYKKSANITYRGRARSRKQLIAEYKTHNEKIVQYRQLKNLVYLHNVKQAYQLMMASMARLLGYSQLWERDIYFTLLALIFLRQVDFTGDEWKPARDAVKTGQILKAMDSIGQIDDAKTLYQDINQLFKLERGPDTIRQTRNDLAHLNPLRNEAVVNITELINRVRTMMAFDRKLKNAVSKSIIELFARENLKLGFKITTGRHELTLKSLQAETIYHLKDSISKKNPITETLHSDSYVNTIKKLL